MRSSRFESETSGFFALEILRELAHIKNVIEPSVLRRWSVARGAEEYEWTSNASRRIKQARPLLAISLLY